ncbi:lytic transglycosylase domain-containing protein [uncultured Tyzzerella sp.]|uniref:lytic transglycosylase domain-containing protein n=1 Tax=uncultured Tyzzerella sp. TaxID=2321398 RepID=UPI002942DF13|nr:lytic transglycosylase domain-containing protein [uncultured Tyzzerella sp.]
MFYILNGKKIIKIFKIIIFFIILILLFIWFVNYILPVKHQNIIEKYAKKYSIEKELVFAVINAESRFNKEAISNKGAIGLMQIMPETGEWLAKKIKIENFSKEMLYDEEININLGCYYLKELINKFEDETLALCAYNAGSTNVYRWLNDDKYSKDGYIHTIPFKETDKYIKKIKIFKKGYSILLKYWF